MSEQFRAGLTQRIARAVEQVEGALLAVYGSADLSGRAGGAGLGGQPPRSLDRLEGLRGLWRLRVASDGHSYVVAA